MSYKISWLVLAQFFSDGIFHLIASDKLRDIQIVSKTEKPTSWYINVNINILETCLKCHQCLSEATVLSSCKSQRKFVNIFVDVNGFFSGIDFCVVLVIYERLNHRYVS